MRNFRDMLKKALETGNSLHKCPPLGNLERVRFLGHLTGRWRDLETEHLLLN